jgi:hypothetical protein
VIYHALCKPTAAAARSANFVLLDNTVANPNTIQLTGTGTLSRPVAARLASSMRTVGTYVLIASYLGDPRNQG